MPVPLRGGRRGGDILLPDPGDAAMEKSRMPKEVAMGKIYEYRTTVTIGDTNLLRYTCISCTSSRSRGSRGT